MPTPQSPIAERLDVLLAAFDADHPTLSLAGLAARSGTPRTTTYRHATTMVQLGWLTLDEGRYRLGTRLFELGSLTDLRSRLGDRAAASLRELAATTGDTVHLAVLDGIDVLYVDKIDGRRPAVGLTRIGGRLPIHCTALGKALVAHSGDDVRERALAAHRRPYTTATIVDPTRLEAELRRVADDGIAVDREESAIGLICHAAPVVTSDGRCVAAASVSGRTDRGRARNLMTSIGDAVAEIGRRLEPA